MQSLKKTGKRVVAELAPALFFSLLVTFLISGCDLDPFANFPGHYEGFVIRKSSGKVTQNVARGEITKRSSDKLELKLADGDRNLEFEFKFRVQERDKIIMTSAEITPREQTLVRSSPECFAFQKSITSFCYNGREISIDFTTGEHGEVLSIVLDRGQMGTKPAFEAPADYTLAQIFQRAVRQNFDSRIQFEHVVQAKLAVKTAYLNMLPHISINSVGALIAFDVAGLIGAIGDLVPFLIPTRWFQMRESELKNESEKDALIIMRADAANMAEGFGLLIQRDAKIMQLLGENIKRARVLRDEILARERLGGFLPGTSDDVTALINSLEQDIVALQSGLGAEYSALAQVTGFVNPAAISSLALHSEVDIEHPEPVDEAAVMDLAYSRSIELRQMNTLIEWSKWNARERYFSWLDPSGDYSGALGLNLITYIPIGASQVREAKLKKDQLEQVVAQKVTNTLRDRVSALRLYQLAKDGLLIQNRRVERLTGQMRLGIAFDPIGLVAALQDLVKTGVAKLTSENAYDIAVSKINRMVFAGPYAGIEFDRPREISSGGVRVDSGRAENKPRP